METNVFVSPSSLTFRDGVCLRSFVVINRSQTDIAFKIESSIDLPRRVIIRPQLGIVKAQRNSPVYCCLMPNVSLNASRDDFSIEHENEAREMILFVKWIPIAGNTDPADIFWPERDFYFETIFVRTEECPGVPEPTEVEQKKSQRNRKQIQEQSVPVSDTSSESAHQRSAQSHSDSDFETGWSTDSRRRRYKDSEYAPLLMVFCICLVISFINALLYVIQVEYFPSERTFIGDF